MHAFLFIGTTSEARNAQIEERIQEWGVKPIDVVSIRLDDAAIGIDAIRELKKRLLLVPYQSPYTVGVIHAMHMLTIEAQNAMLKLLEEPPAHTRILGETAQVNSLLPTIISRCQLVSVGSSASIQPSDELTSSMEILKQTQHVSVGRRLQMTEEITKTRDAAKQWVNLAIEAARNLLISDPASVETGRLVRRLILAKQQLDANVTPKLVLDNIFLSL